MEKKLQAIGSVANKYPIGLWPSNGMRSSSSEYSRIYAHIRTNLFRHFCRSICYVNVYVWTGRFSGNGDARLFAGTAHHQRVLSVSVCRAVLHLFVGPSDNRGRQIDRDVRLFLFVVHERL